MFGTNFWIYVWDLEDEGIGEVLDRLHGEVGATGISVATSYHSVDHLRIHADVSPRVYRADGGIYFQPDTKHYAATRLKPITSPYIKSRNPLAKIAEACARRHMKLRSWTVFGHNSYLVARHESFACRNVFGDLNPTWLCPANPDVREYFRALVADLTENYPLQAVEVESMLYPARLHHHRHEKIGIALGEADQFLLGLCFCESCRQSARRAGADIDAAARSTRVRLEKSFQAGRSATDRVEALLDEDEPIRGFARWRVESMTELVAAIKASCRASLVMYDIGKMYATGGDAMAINEHVDAFLGMCYRPDLDQVDAAVARLRKLKPDNAGVELGFHGYPPNCPDAPTLVRQFTRAAELGVRSANVYHYGIMPEANLDWVRQAVRAATRAAS
jgi:hypothetical protein